MNQLKTLTLLFSVFVISNSYLNAQWETVADDSVKFEQIITIDDNTLIGKGMDELYISNNNGQSWEYMESTPDLFYFRAIAFNNGKLYLGTQFENMMRVSADTGKTWQIKNNGIGSCTIKDIYAKDDIIMAATYQNGIYISLDEGEHWYDKDSGIDTTLVLKVAVTDSLCLASTHKGLYYSRDTANSWMLNSFFSNKLVDAFHVKDSLVYVTSDTNLYVSKDYGFTWEQINIKVENSNYQIGRFYHIDSNDSLLFLGSHSIDLFSTDNGNTWYNPSVYIYGHSSDCSVIHGDYVITRNYKVERAKVSDFFVDTISIDAYANKTKICESDTIKVWANGNNLFDYAVYQGNTFKCFNDTLVLNNVSKDASNRYYLRGSNFRTQKIDSIDILVKASEVYTTADTSICPGEEIVLNGYNGINMSWSDGVENGIPFIPESSKNYFMHAFDTACNSYVYNTAKIIVFEQPVVDLGNDVSISETDEVVLFADEGYPSYLWNNNQDFISDSLIVNANAYDIGTYTFYVEVTDNNECKGSDTVTVEITQHISDLEESNADQQFKVYPVPFHNSLYLENSTGTNAEVIIYTLSGQKVYSKSIHQSVNHLQIPDGAPGTYIIEVRLNKNNAFRQPIIRY